MANGQPTKTEKEYVKLAVSSAAYRKSKVVADTQKPASVPLSNYTTATTPNDSPKTSKTPALSELKLAADGLVAALSDWQTAGGLVVVKNRQTLVEGRIVEWVSVGLVAGGFNMTKHKTTDGIEFNLAADVV